MQNKTETRVLLSEFLSLLSFLIDRRAWLYTTSIPYEVDHASFCLLRTFFLINSNFHWVQVIKSMG